MKVKKIWFFVGTHMRMFSWIRHYIYSYFAKFERASSFSRQDQFLGFFGKLSWSKKDDWN